MPDHRMTLPTALVNGGICTTRQEACKAILGGVVSVDGHTVWYDEEIVDMGVDHIISYYGKKYDLVKVSK